jgi:hypothetical protein
LHLLPHSFWLQIAFTTSPSPQLSADDFDQILVYLLSKDDLKNIINLPVTRLGGGGYTALQNVGAKPHVLLTQREWEIFGELDALSIALHSLPANPAKLLKTEGPDILNVSPLTPHQAVEYVRLFSHRHGLDLTIASQHSQSPAVIGWLTSFWKWFAGWALKPETYDMIRSFPLIPTSKNVLVSPKDAVFSQLREGDRTLKDGLEMLGISFLHADFPDSARIWLAKDIKSPYLVHHILDSFVTPPGQLDAKSADILLHHLERFFGISCNELGPLTDDQRRKLRALPIFPLLLPATSSTEPADAAPMTACIPDQCTVFSVTSLALLPLIKDTVFLKNHNAVLEYLQLGVARNKTLDAMGVISLAVDHMLEQPKHLQCAFIEHIFSHRGLVSHNLLDKLSQIPFVVVGDGAFLSCANAIFDPDCEVAALLRYLPNDPRLPLLSDPFQERIICGLKKLRFLKDRLEDNIVELCINFIANSAMAGDLSRRILRLLVDSCHDCSGIRVDPHACWLPTTSGTTKGSADCHHPDAHRSALFDRVVPTLDIPHVSSSLCKAFGWDMPICLEIVLKQFSLVVEGGQRTELLIIIEELSERIEELSEKDLESLRSLTANDPWVPVAGNQLATTSHAILCNSHYLPRGFHIVPSELADNPRIRQLLSLMGCTDRWVISSCI